MCLATVETTRTHVREGYKFFAVSQNGKLKPLYFNYWGGFTKRRWIRDLPTARERITAGDGKGYRKGFHFYEDLERLLKKSAKEDTDPDKIKLHRVLVKDIVASGTQFGLKVSVARRMFIMEEVPHANKNRE